MIFTLTMVTTANNGIAHRHRPPYFMTTAMRTAVNKTAINPDKKGLLCIALANIGFASVINPASTPIEVHSPSAIVRARMMPHKVTPRAFIFTPALLSIRYDISVDVSVCVFSSPVSPRVSNSVCVWSYPKGTHHLGTSGAIETVL